MTRPTQARFGLAAAEAAAASAGDSATRRTFGRRVRPVQKELSFRLARLEVIQSELDLILGDPVFAEASIARLQKTDPPAITLATASGGMLRIEVDDETGLLVLLHDDGGGGAGSVLVTPSEDQLIDHVLSHLVGGDGAGSRREIDKGADLLVGQSLEDILNIVVLRTLRHYRGSRHRSAVALGIPLAELRTRLRQALRWADGQREAGA